MPQLTAEDFPLIAWDVIGGSGRVVSVHTLVATGVIADGHPEILSVQVLISGDGAGWLGFVHDLIAPATSAPSSSPTDAHRGPVFATDATLPAAS